MSDATAIPNASATSQAPARSQRGLAFLDRGLLLGIALVTCIVSLPRFHGMLLSSNEQDARHTVDILAKAANHARLADPSLKLDGPNLAAWLATEDDLTHQLEDLRLAPDGNSVLYHGYQLSIQTDAQGPTVLAWPTRLNRTGRWAYTQRSGESGLRTQAWDQVGYPPRYPAQPSPHWLKQ
ncbi:MAG: hypothetical protein ACI8QC_000068 [Planctomycetota bacterium]|jgi:hypothetical protein